MKLEQLIEEIKHGQRLAQKAMFDRYSKRFLTLSFRYLNDRHFAEDACLEAFVLIFKGLEKFEFYSEQQTEAWMKRVVVNQSLKILNINKKLVFENIEVHQEANTFLESHNDIEAEDLLKIILQMPLGYRTVFNMYVVEGYSHAEIGEILKITESTSRSQLTKAKAFLKEKLKGEYIAN